MNNLGLCMLAALLVGCGGSDPEVEPRPVLGDDTAATSSRAERVVVIVMDGVRWNESFSTEISSATGEPGNELLPRIHQTLLSQGGLGTHALAAGVTITSAGHHDLLTGTRRDFGNYPNPDGAAWYRPELPTVFEEARSQLGLGEDAVVLLANTALVEGLAWGLYPGLSASHGAKWDFVTATPGGTTPTGSDRPVGERIQEHLTAGAKLIVANLHAADRAGHNGVVEAYPANVEQQDEIIARIWQDIGEDEDLRDTTGLILVADHGRHDKGTEEDWRNHGDHCAGCRRLPLLIIGPGVDAGQVHGAAVLLEDVGRTIAWWLGVDLPHSTGRILEEFFVAPDLSGAEGQPALGPVWAQSSGGILVEEILVDDTAARSLVRVGETQLSTEGALAAEAPVLTTTDDRAYMCHREFDLDPSMSTWPWVGHCWTQADGLWSELSLPFGTVSPHWLPAMVPRPDQTLHMVHVDTPNGIVTEGQDGTPVRLLQWTEASGWRGSEDGIETVSLPTHPALALAGETSWLAFASSELGSGGRKSRHIQVHTADWDEALGEMVYVERLHTLGVELDGQALARMERPSLHVDGDDVLLAFYAVLEDGLGAVVTMASPDRGATWGAVLRVDEGGRVLAHISPQFADDGALVWGQVGLEGRVEICRLAGTTQCLDAGTSAIQSLDLVEDGVMYTSNAGQHLWSVETLTF